VKAGDDHRQGHRQRLRDKFLSSGLAGFHDYEVIELLLTLATPRKDCKTSAKAALEKFKSLPGVLEAATADLCAIEGIGPVNVFGIKLVKAVADRCLEQKLEGGTPLNNSGDLYDYLRLTMRDKSREVFKAVFLDAKNRIIASENLFTGTLTASAVYPREVVAAVLRHHAAAVIFAHNHPSGDPRPSEEDVAITRRLVQACAVMDITVHEHLIVGGNGYFSFADQGYMTAIRRDIESQDGDRP
jgi:DNA repair protein RadC